MTRGWNRIVKRNNPNNKKTDMEKIETYMPYLRGYDYTGKFPVVIDFFATWCGPCKALAPQLERLARDYEGRLKVLKVDIDKNTALADAAGIRSVPTLFLVALDGTIERHVGGLPYDALTRLADGLLQRSV